MVVNFRSYINREIFCCFFAEQASLANTRVYNYKNEIKMALHCLSTSGVSGTKKMHILRTEFALISILPRKGKRIARFREEVYSWRDVKTGLDIIEKYSFFWKIGGRRTLPSLRILEQTEGRLATGRGFSLEYVITWPGFASVFCFRPVGTSSSSSSSPLSLW